MAANRITVRVEGDPRDRGHVRLNEFLQQLEAVKAALRQTERVLGLSNKTPVYYRIIDLSHSSPATVVMEGVADLTKPNADPTIPGKIVGSFFTSLNTIKKKGEIPQGFDYLAAESFRDISATLQKHVTSLVLTNGRYKVKIDQQFEDKIAKAIGPDETTEGSIA